MRGSLNTFGLEGSVTDQPIVFREDLEHVTMIKLARAGKEGVGEGIGCHRRLVLICGEKIPDMKHELEPLDPIEAMGYDLYR